VLSAGDSDGIGAISGMQRRGEPALISGGFRVDLAVVAMGNDTGAKSSSVGIPSLG
jgi:hypothetical protein